MITTRRSKAKSTARTASTPLAASVAFVVVLTACSSTGAPDSTGPSAEAGTADTPRATIAMITHAPPGDTFQDLIRKGAEAAAAKDNIALRYNGFGGTIEKLNVDGQDLPSVHSTIQAKLRQDPSIDSIVTLEAPIALTAVDSGSGATVSTFGTNAVLVDAIKSGDVQWAIDQQPYL